MRGHSAVVFISFGRKARISLALRFCAKQMCPAFGRLLLTRYFPFNDKVRKRDACFAKKEIIGMTGVGYGIMGVDSGITWSRRVEMEAHLSVGNRRRAYL